MGPEVLILGVHENTRGGSVRLFQNEPNPAGDETRISIQLNSSQGVNLMLTDVLGREVSTIVNEHMNKGIHTIVFDTKEIPNGIYYYTLKMEGYIQTRRMIISR
jgi:hypothetical protein